jgi:hypothetical protein
MATTTETQNLIEALNKVTDVMNKCLETVAPGASSAGAGASSAGSAGSAGAGSASVASSAGPSGSASSQPNKKITLALKLEENPATSYKVTECRVVKDTPTKLAQFHNAELWIKYELTYVFKKISTFNKSYELDGSSLTKGIKAEDQIQLTVSPQLPNGTFDIDDSIIEKITKIANNDKLFSDITLKYDATKLPASVFEIAGFTFNEYIKIIPDILVSNADNKYLLSLSDESKDKLQIENPKTDLNVTEDIVNKINTALAKKPIKIKGGKKSRQTRKGGKKRRRNTKRR